MIENLLFPTESGLKEPPKLFIDPKGLYDGYVDDLWTPLIHEWGNSSTRIKNIYGGEDNLVSVEFRTDMFKCGPGVEDMRVMLPFQDATAEIVRYMALGYNRTDADILLSAPDVRYYANSMSYPNTVSVEIVDGSHLPFSIEVDGNRYNSAGRYLSLHYHMDVDEFRQSIITTFPDLYQNYGDSSSKMIVIETDVLVTVISGNDEDGNFKAGSDEIFPPGPR